MAVLNFGQMSGLPVLGAGAGEVVLEETELELKFSFPTMPYGDFLMEVVLMDGVTIVGCFEYTIAAIPRASSRRKKKGKQRRLQEES